MRLPPVAYCSPTATTKKRKSGSPISRTAFVQDFLDRNANPHLIGDCGEYFADRWRRLDSDSPHRRRDRQPCPDHASDGIDRIRKQVDKLPLRPLLFRGENEAAVRRTLQEDSARLEGSSEKPKKLWIRSHVPPADVAAVSKSVRVPARMAHVRLIPTVKSRRVCMSNFLVPAFSNPPNASAVSSGSCLTPPTRRIRFSSSALAFLRSKIAAAKVAAPRSSRTIAAKAKHACG